MASLSELVEYAKAKQPRNGLAEVAAHFLQGADQGFDAGKKAQLGHIDQILKTAQAAEAQQKTRELQIQNDMWQSMMDNAKGTGKLPMTPGEMINGRAATNNSLGEKANATPGNFDLAKLFENFMPAGQDNEVTAHMKTPFGTVTVGPKPRKQDSSDTSEKREKRILREKIYKQAMDATAAEDPMAKTPNPKYLGDAARYYGEDPAEYVPKPAPVDDPYGLLGGK